MCKIWWKLLWPISVAVTMQVPGGSPALLTEHTAESYAATFDTNVLGTLFCLKHELRVMLAQGHRAIINFSSGFGIRGGVGAALYSASKHAAEGLTKSAALEAAPRGFG